MKKRGFLAMSLISLALVACSSDEEINNVIDQENEGEALVTLTLDVAKPQTKGSPGATNTQAGTDAENAITNVTVVVDYGNNVQKFFTSSQTSSNDVSWDADNKKMSFKAPAGDATFYVYANVNNSDQLTTNWATNMASAGTDISAYYKEKEFFMSNQNGTGVSHTINPATANAVTVNIERAAAKVTVESAGTFMDTNAGGQLTAMSFTLGNMVNKFYLLQQSPIAIPTGVNYSSTTTDDDWISVTLGQSVNGENAVEKTSLTGDYCMENIQTTYYQNNTTYAKFQTTFIPGKVWKYADNKWSLEDNSSTTATTFYVILEGDNQLTSGYILATDLSQDNLTETTEKDGYTVSNVTGITKVSKPYTDGKCYFGPIWFNLNEAGDASPVYRNDWYHLIVKSIKLPGSPTEPNPDTEEPLVSDVNVTVTATVLNWEWEEREIELQ